MINLASPLHGVALGPAARWGERQAACPDGDTLMGWALDQAPLPLGFYDAQLRILRLPAVVTRWLGSESPRLAGLGEGNLQGKRLTDLLPGNPVVERVTRHMRRVVETGEAVR
jgi:hypothetical protein